MTKADAPNHKDEYSDQVVARLQLLWGEGFMSPGGPEEVAELLSNIDLTGKHVLDIGCGIGGVELLLVREYKAKHVTGIDIEEPLLVRARRRVLEAGLEDYVSFRHISPGPLPFDNHAFDVVFSKDAMIHIPDKPSLFTQVRRVLSSGGQLVASDWLQSDQARGSEEMKKMSEAIGLTFSLTTPSETIEALELAGFKNVTLRDRNPVLREQSLQELERLAGPLREQAVSIMGREKYEKWLLARRLICEAMDKNYLLLSHIVAQRP